MLNIKFDKITLDKSRFYRYLLVLYLVLFALYPLIDAALDAYSDHALHDIRMSPDERINTARRNEHPTIIVTLLQRIACPRIEDLVIQVFETGTIPDVAIKSSQAYPPLSSDPSPPRV